MRLHRYRPVALVLLVLHLGACTTWRPATVSPPQLIEEEEPGRVRITRTDGERVTIQDPEVRADSIIWRRRSGLFGFGTTETGLPILDVQQIEIRRFSLVKTLITLIPVALIAVLVGVCLADGDDCNQIGN